MHSDKDISRFSEISPRTAVIVAGLGLFMMTILAFFANFFLFSNLIVPGDAKTTSVHIMASGELLRIGISCFLVVALLDVVVAWALYVLLQPVNKHLSLLAAWFRVVYAAIFATALNNLLSVLQLLTGADSFKVFATNQVHAQVMVFLSAFQSGWDIGLVLFGLHLLVLGSLVFKSGYIPRWLGVLLTISSVGYLVDGFGKFLLPDYHLAMTLFTGWGELFLMFWLLWRAMKGFDKRRFPGAAVALDGRAHREGDEKEKGGPNESHSLHTLWTTRSSSAQRGAKTCSQEQ